MTLILEMFQFLKTYIDAYELVLRGNCNKYIYIIPELLLMQFEIKLNKYIMFKYILKYHDH